MVMWPLPTLVSILLRLPAEALASCASESSTDSATGVSNTHSLMLSRLTGLGRRPEAICGGPSRIGRPAVAWHTVVLLMC